MTITHHLDDATLMSFAAGSLPESLSAVAAAHVAMCGRCRREVAALERLGGALLAGLPSADLDRSTLVPPAGAMIRRAASSRGGSASEVPAPLIGLVGGDLDALRWRWLGLGVWHLRLSLAGRGALSLLKVSPGRAIPEHRHAGSELTLVLRGSFEDATGRYRPGDVADLDDSIAHTPVAGPGADCICVVASEKPAHFRGLLARMIQPRHGH
jgi:putative transcriptional regulator